tara:strand:+ start:766 stop:1038 length:273 start_codon:yes stop_codon:yes gene_type:complete
MTTFEEYNEPTEMKKWKVSALIQCEDITYKAAVTPIIDAWKQAMYLQTEQIAYANYCPGCVNSECIGHTYSKYCEFCQEIVYESNYPPDY